VNIIVGLGPQEIGRGKRKTKDGVANINLREAIKEKQ
jgi:hypothetical protein